MRRDPLFKGCTRPAMILGVPLVPLAVVIGVVVLLSIWTTLLLAFSLVPIVITMRMIVKADDQQFRLLWLKFWCRVVPHCARKSHLKSNQRFWQASTYSPISFKKR
jgi:type IV secretory pathway VirB3-like protein